MTERDNLLNDIYFKVDIQEHLAKKYQKTPSYVSQLAKWLKQLEYTPLIKNDKLVCSYCQESETSLVFHHDHKTNQLIALVCQSCNLKLRNKDFSGEILYGDEFKNIGVKEGYKKISIDVPMRHWKIIEADAKKDMCEGWYYHCDNSNGGSIYIKDDGIILYHWHYNYSDSLENWWFQSILMSAYFTMLICFLPLFYNEINYKGKLHLKLEINGIEKSVFYPHRNSSSRKVYPYNQTPFNPIKRIIFLNKITQREEKIRVIHEIFNEILSRYFNYYYYQIPNECMIFFNL